MKSSSLAAIGSFIRLTKPIITLSVAFSALCGYILFSGTFSSGWFTAWFGVLLIAAGSSALNQVQERHTDAMMERTRHRPLPAGQVKLRHALVWVLLLSGSGALLLFVFAGIWPALLAILTLVWYNGLYTPLKLKTPWAILPGAVVGALPPVIGWTAAGGAVNEQAIVLVAAFFFMGQIPHFWLILLRYGQDYQKAGFPSATALLSSGQISRMTFVWVLATAISAVFLFVFQVVQGWLWGSMIMILSLALIISFYQWPGLKSPQHLNRAFLIMNLYFLSIMLILIAQSVLGASM